MEVFAALVERARDRLGGREWKDRQDVESLLLFSTIYWVLIEVWLMLLQDTLSPIYYTPKEIEHYGNLLESYFELCRIGNS